MLESPWEERGASIETGGAEAGGDGQHRGEGGVQGAGGDWRSEADAGGREKTTQPRINSTSQRREEVGRFGVRE